MTLHLALSVRAHDGRYHGVGDGPPSPFRLFQALVAGVGLSGPLGEPATEALEWLECLRAPVIAAPRTTRGHGVAVFMPNNDADTVGSDPRRLGKLRTDKKVTRPVLFDARVPWMYAWRIDPDDEARAATVCRLAERLYQLGRGIDMAWAWGELLDDATLEARLAEHDGVVLRPTVGPADGLTLACPRAGSLLSLERRHRAQRFRFLRGERVFVQAPKPLYDRHAYESPPARHVFDLRCSTDSSRRTAWPLTAASSLVVAARELARARLRDVLPGRVELIDQFLVGRKPDGTNAGPADARVRVVPIPSIGTRHTDRGIRRLLVEVPAACPLRSDDVRWAFSGGELFDPETGEAHDIVLSPSPNDDMLRHYGLATRARVFRTVTPAVLPESAKRRRIDPARKFAEAKGGAERVTEVLGATSAVAQALRHAGVRAPVEGIRVQREPFETAGARVEPFAHNTRFPKERLWHVEIAFSVGVEGPLLIGDGRFLGLGLMAPVPDLVSSAHAFAIVDGLDRQASALDLARALRRAVMARVQGAVGERAKLAPFFTGHAEDGSPVRRDRSSHLAFAYEPRAAKLLVIAPHLLDRRPATEEEMGHLRTLEVALDGIRELRAGAAGVLTLVRVESDSVARAYEWQSVTPYVMTRHAKGLGASAALVADVRAECARSALPEPAVDVRDVRGVAGVGVVGEVRLRFRQAMSGPILLGKTRYFGGGLFRPVDPPSA
jgi:CRISPR-associated protein Csb2